MKTFLIVIIFSLSIGISNVFGTAQVPDLLIIENDTFLLHSNPLEAYLDSIGDRELPGFKGVSSTACWRGYQAVWRLQNDSIFLERIRSCHSGENTSDADLEIMFEEKYKNGKVFASWVNGLLVLPYGEMVNYVHMGYGSTYEKNKLLEIHHGICSKTLDLNHKEFTAFKEKQFSHFKKTEEYQKIFKELKEEEYDDEFIESFLKNYIVKYTSIIYGESND